MAQQPAPPFKRAATYADIEALPEHQIGEILDGELIVSPRPASRHALASSSLGNRVGPPFHDGVGGPGGWWILDEPELHLGGDVLVPDLAGWRRERMPTFPDVKFFTLAPDWVCEVLSPSTESTDRARKLRIYAREHVPYAWLVTPGSRLLEVFRLEGDFWLLVAAHRDDEIVRAEPFDAVELDLLPLWGEARAPAGQVAP
jgi:Uma2 family endonuclease